MNVPLTPELEAIIQQRIATGRYESASDVIHEALMLLNELDRIRDHKFAEVREKVSQGFEQLERGEFTEHDAESLAGFFEAIKKRGRLRRESGTNRAG